MLWFLETESGDWRLAASPTRLTDTKCEAIASRLADLDRSPRDAWHQDLDWEEVLEYERPLLAVRNFIESVDREEN